MKNKIQTNYFLTALCLLAPAYAYAAKPNTAIATINTGITPAGIAITHNGHYLYVANNNNYGIAGQDSVSVLDLKHNLPSQIIFDSSFNQPYTVTINHAGTRAYVTNSNSTTVTIINIMTNQVCSVIDGFDGPSGMAITSDDSFAYVNNYGGPEGLGSGNGRTVSVVDLNSNTIIETITVGLAPAALAISPDDLFVYVINYVDGNTGTGTMSVIRTCDDTVIETVTGLSGPFGIALTPSGKHAFISNFGSNNFAPIGTTVTAINLQSYEIVATINVGIQPAGIAITPDGDLAYVTNYNTLYMDGTDFTGLTAGQGTVNIIDTHAKKVLSPTIAVGQSPDAITISSCGKYAYVTNFTSNTVTVIKLDH